MKRDLRLAAYGSVELQQFEFIKVCCMGKTVIDIIAEILIFCNKNDLPQCLVVFSIAISLLSSIRSLLSKLSLFGFPLLRKSKGYTLDSGLTSDQRRKKATEILPAAPIPPQNHSTGLSAPFQLQSSESKKASHPE